MAATTTAVPILRDRAILATDMVALAFKIVRMTAGTIGLEGRIGPVDLLRIVLVASRAGEIAAVIKRLVRKAGMPERVRNPGHCVVTGVAFPWRHEVPWIPASCGDAVMAGRAGTEHLGVVDPYHRDPRDGVMAILTNIGRLHVTGSLTGRVGPVVAAETVACDVYVIEVRREPCERRMAVIAVVAARDMRRVFAGRDRAVVAGEASADDLDMVD